MRFSKQNNQYYGSYFEQAIVSLINREKTENNTTFSFTKEEMEEMNEDAKKLTKQIFPNETKAQHTGINTSLASGDIIVNGKDIEIKYVSSGNGTHFNTSVSYTEEALDYQSMSNFMREQGLYDLARESFGEIYDVNPQNTSPVTMKTSSLIRKDKGLTERYSLYKEEEARLRAKYVEDFLQHLNSNVDKATAFISHMLSKEISNKSLADKLIVFNHENKTVTEFDKEELLLRKDNSELTLQGEYSITNGKIKATFSWQNGIGLNNPTIRVFLM